MITTAANLAFNIQNNTVFQATGEVRWVERESYHRWPDDIHVSPLERHKKRTNRTLQQAFRNMETGDIEWRDVPIVKEGGL